VEPTPQPQPQLQGIDPERETACEVIKPSIILMEIDRSIKLLLSRDTLIEPTAVHLRGVRLIEIPLGWRLTLMRIASRFWRVRLPDELEFASIRIHRDTIPSLVRAGNSLVGKVRDPSQLIELTGPEYFALAKMSGRMLHSWVEAHFAIARQSSEMHSSRRHAA
jgi:hypothetical protein